MLSPRPRPHLPAQDSAACTACLGVGALGLPSLLHPCSQRLLSLHLSPCFGTAPENACILHPPLPRALGGIRIRGDEPEGSTAMEGLCEHALNKWMPSPPGLFLSDMALVSEPILENQSWHAPISPQTDVSFVSCLFNTVIWRYVTRSFKQTLWAV